jgi:TRAP-type C4-dicarboxylate transport system permease large subunit
VDLLRVLLEVFSLFFTPIIILGSIMFGIATPAEAAVLYSLALGFK